MTELLIVLFVALLVFGATKIPAVGDALGRALRGPGARAARGGEPDAPAPRARRQPPA
jgi:sec-independent protein translocase protein TatA